MAESRRDKKRNKKVLKYKKSKKMSKVPESKPFRQVPTWQSADMFEIRGDELEALYNYFNIVAPAFTAVQQIFARGFQGGKIQFSYEYEDGTQANPEEVKAYTEKLNEYFENIKREKEIDGSDTSVEFSKEAPKLKIVSAEGERIAATDLK